MVQFFVEKRAAVFSFALLIVIVGISAYLTLPKESTPEIKQPYIFVTTLYPGVGARDIENLVTRVIEEKIDGLEGLDEISSTSQQSLSFIFVKFTSDIAVETALRRVRERVDLAKPLLPKEAEDPTIQELSSSSWPVFIALMSHPGGLQLLDQAATMVEDELGRVPGVLDVRVAGRLSREVAVEIDPLKLEHYGFSLNTVMNAIQFENMAIPGGILRNEARSYSISITGEIKDPSLFEDIVVKANGKNVRLGELGTARFTWAEPETYSRLNGKPCISFSITKRSGQNIITMASEVKKKLEEMKSKLPEGTQIAISYDDSKQIGDIVLDLENNIITAFLLVFGVTIFFLGFRNSLFVSLAIPFSMLMSFFVLQSFGITLNMVVLFSLVLALGMLVDNGIVIVENIFRHAAMGKDRIRATIDGVQEVAWPISTSTLTTVLAFFPIIFMPDVMGDFMSYLPKTVIIVLSCSLVVALTINPVFCASFMNISERSRKQVMEGSGLFSKIQSAYERVLVWSIRHSALILIGVVVLVVSGFGLYGALGKEPLFFPKVDPSTAVVSLETPQGTPLDLTDSIVRRVEAIVPTSPASLKHIQATTGQGADDDFFSGGGGVYHKANLRVEYQPFLERTIPSFAAIESLKVRLVNLTGAKVVVKEIEGGPPTGHDISYEITGDDYLVLGVLADSVKSILNRYPQFKLVDTDYEAAKPEIAVRIDRKKAAFYGLSTGEIASAVRNAINGATVGTFREGEKEYDIVVRYSRDFRSSFNNLAGVTVMNRDDIPIALSSVAEILPRSSVGLIKRRNLNRAVQVWADFSANVPSTESIKNAVEQEVKRLRIPAGYSIGAGQGLEMRNEATAFLARAFLIALFLILIVLITQFNSILQSVIIMIAVVLSFGGVFWGYVLSGQHFVIIMSGIGTISLAGVVVNNCIVLVDYTNLLIRQGMPWREAVVKGGRTRLRPVLLTALTTILGLLPMALGVSLDFHKFTVQIGSESGQYFVPFAWAMIYGLTFGTVLTLIIVPVLLSVYFKLLPPKQAASAAAQS